MKIKECIKYASECLSLDAITDYLDSESSLSSTDEAELAMLNSCLKSVMNEIACEYVPLKYEETITIEENKISYDDLTYQAIEILKIKRNGREEKIKTYFDGIWLDESGEYTVSYYFSPSDFEYGSDLPWQDERVNSRNIGWGIASEYCIRCGMLDDAIMWDKRYKDSIAKASSVRRELKVVRRRWL